jgi:hypothetical protein
MTALWLILGGLLAFSGLAFWLTRIGGEAERSRAAADRQRARADALEERLEMHRDADEIERRAAGMSDDELNRRLTK